MSCIISPRSPDSFATLAAASLVGPALADDRAFTYGGVFGVSYTNGGDTVDELNYVNGAQQKIKAGGMYNIKLGGEMRFKELPLQIQASLNYHYNNDGAASAEARHTGIPLELLAFYNFNSKWRVGGGLRYVTSSKYTFKFEDREELEFKFKPSLGYVVEGEYFYSSGASVSARYVNISLPWNYDIYSGKLSGSHVGFGFNIYW